MTTQPREIRAPIEAESERRTVLFRAPGDHDQRVIRERPLEPQCLQGRCRHPEVDLFLRRQDHRHGLRVTRANDSVRLGREEAENVVAHLALFDLPR
jgi:hypothetical protein